MPAMCYKKKKTGKGTPCDLTGTNAAMMPINIGHLMMF